MSEVAGGGAGGLAGVVGPAGLVGHWWFGEVEVLAILETDQAFSADFMRTLLPDASRERVREVDWLSPRWADASGDLRFWTQTFVVRSAGRTLLVDTCLGNDKERRNPAFHRLATPFIERLLAASVRVEDVDLVVCTHLHFDHVGWNTRRDEAGRWVPTFPNARYLFSRREWEHWGPRPGHAYVVADSIQPLFDAGLVDLVDLENLLDEGRLEDEGWPLTAEVSLVPTPGHSPGHCSVRIESGGALALITGDLIHHPCQVAHPEWGSPSDTDAALALATRQRILSWADETGATIIGTHFAAPAAGRVRGARFWP
ncbi:MAG TPA: MBL fold metallo-hydrolase [Myxococcota bacterium]|nr:MBL fold metallo-hydrolase [Myxococcota bacterium]